MPTQHVVVHGDSRRLDLVEDASVQLVATSPPYWQLKDYGDERQIGFHETYEEYINSLNMVWRECYRALSPGCRMCVNIGDQFARAVYYGRYKVIPIQAEIIRYCESIVFDFMGSVIWQKVTTTNTTGGATIMGSFPYPRNGIVKIDYEHILLFKKPGKAPVPTAEQKEQSKLTIAEWNEYFAGHWKVPGARQTEHLAAFPLEIPRRLIRMFSFAGETVLDPFLGSGTTALAAAEIERNSIGYELEEGNISIIADRLKGNAIQVLKQTESPPSESSEKQFVDPHSLDKLIDPHHLQFGSKISAS